MMNQIKPYVLVIIFAWTAAACQKGPEDDAKLGETNDLVLTAMELQKVEADNAFTFELFSQATRTLAANQNVLLSPLSVGMALAMTNTGAAGETRVAIENTLKFGEMTTEEINAYYKKLATDLPRLDPRTSFNIANSIWYSNDLVVLPEFVDVNRTFYDAEVTSLDFADPRATDRINEWVSKKTQDKIPTILDESTPLSGAIYLINALYFKGQWEKRFDKAATKTQTFTRPGNNPLETDFMNLEDTFHVSAMEDVQAIELPYGNKKYSMVILKPQGERTPEYLREKLQKTDMWSKLVAGFQPRQVMLALPKFQFSYENTLNDELIGMGMGIAFDKSAADFSGISRVGNLSIDEVKHKSFINVNEEGTEAAAVTSVKVGYALGPTFFVDRPFLFAIREMETGLILFIGQVNDPSVEKSKG